MLEKTGVTGGADATATTAIASDKTVAASATTVNSAIAEDAQADHASWLTPVACCAVDGNPLSLADYLKLVDLTGRILRTGKRGTIPARLASILARLDLDIDRWPDCMLGWRQFLGAAVGRLISRATEAARRGLKWVQNRCALFVERPQAIEE